MGLISSGRLQQVRVGYRLRPAFGVESLARFHSLTSAKQVSGVHRDCYSCGRTCTDCAAVLTSTCRNCTTPYCLKHDDGCSAVEVRVCIDEIIVGCGLRPKVRLV